MATLAAALAASLPKISVIDDLEHPNRAGKNPTSNIPTSALPSLKDSTQRRRLVKGLNHSFSVLYRGVDLHF